MKLRLHVDFKTSGYVVVEASPQMRSLRVNSGISSSIYVPLPYVTFVIRYVKRNGILFYPGLYGKGLHVCGSLKPLSSIDDKFFALPTDTSYIVCTDHDFDGSKYDDLKSLVNSVIAVWYGSIHYVYYHPFSNGWRGHKVDEIYGATWGHPSLHPSQRVVGFDQILNVLHQYEGQKSTKTTILDDNWPIDLQVSMPDRNEYDGLSITGCNCAECVSMRIKQQRGMK